MALRIVYSVGKGGVGKTTCAAGLALQASRVWPTLVVSLDPAHNLGDVIGRRLSGEATAVSSNLWASEVDMDAAVAGYLADSTRRLQSMYGYLKTINLDGYLDALKLSPGIEEYATLQVMERLLGDAAGRYDVVVFDTPPTGLTLRVLALPRVSLLWGERLSGLRREILDRRQILRNIHGERKYVIDGVEHALATDEKSDGVMGELRDYVDRMRRLTALQADASQTRVMPVMNPDRLSLFETQRALETLRSLGMPIGPVIVNKVGLKPTDGQTVQDIGRALGLPTRILPFTSTEPVGLEALELLTSTMDFREWIPGPRTT
ncbi:MAG: ArsA family ATPase [Dehalococcoidia bacterium]|jgi:arsenite-transporting ATPase|nr:ArsA family ATPase [Dehalococcoidia bacterium]